MQASSDVPLRYIPLKPGLKVWRHRAVWGWGWGLLSSPHCIYTCEKRQADRSKFMSWLESRLFMCMCSDFARKSKAKSYNCAGEINVGSPQGWKSQIYFFSWIGGWHRYTFKSLVCQKSAKKKRKKERQIEREKDSRSLTTIFLNLPLMRPPSL